MLRVLYDFQSEHERELSVSEGDIVEQQYDNLDGWTMVVDKNEHFGLVPTEYLDIENMIPLAIHDEPMHVTEPIIHESDNIDVGTTEDFCPVDVESDTVLDTQSSLDQSSIAGSLDTSDHAILSHEPYMPHEDPFTPQEPVVTNVHLDEPYSTPQDEPYQPVEEPIVQEPISELLETQTPREEHFSEHISEPVETDVVSTNTMEDVTTLTGDEETDTKTEEDEMAQKRRKRASATFKATPLDLKKKEPEPEPEPKKEPEVIDRQRKGGRLATLDQKLKRLTMKPASKSPVTDGAESTIQKQKSSENELVITSDKPKKGLGLLKRKSHQTVDASPTKAEPLPPRVNIVNEIKLTEQKYLESLEILNKTYLQEIISKKLFTVTRELDSLQKILGIIISTNTLLHKNLQTDSDDVGKKFLSVIPFLKMYTDYFNTYERFCSVLKTQKKENKKFTEWLSKTEQKCKSTGQLTMQMYLIMPVQRIPRYNLLLKELLKNTEQTHADYENIKKALDGTVSVSSFLNEKVLEKDNQKKYRRLCNHLIIQDETIKTALMQPYRKFIYSSTLQIVESSEVKVALNLLNQPFYCVLLNDLFFVIKEEVPQVEGEEKKMTLLISVGMENLTSVSPVENEPLQFRMDVLETNYTFLCDKPETVEEWMKLMFKPVVVKETKNQARTVSVRADKWGAKRNAATKLNVVKKV